MVTDKEIGEVWKVARGKMRGMGMNTADQKKVIAAMHWCAATEDMATGGTELYGLTLMQDALDSGARDPVEWLVSSFKDHESRGIDMSDVKAVCRELIAKGIERSEIDERISQLIRGER